MTHPTGPTSCDETAFLAAIRATPDDRTTRLAYADWLTERDDPRHELIRTCEAMRDVPVWSDRYWDLKAWRNKLWTSVPLEWLEATGYDGSWYDPIFRDGVPDDVRGRWRLIREFTERWHGVAVPDAGGQRAAIRHEEERLGLRLPPSVQEFIAFAHDLPQMCIPERLGGPGLFHCGYYRVSHTVGHPGVSLVIFTLSEGLLGVVRDDLEWPDPRTHVIDDRRSDGDDGSPTPPLEPPLLFEPTLSLSIYTALFTDLPKSGDMRAIATTPGEWLDRLAADFPIHARFDDADVFERDEMMVCVRRLSGRGRSARDAITVNALLRRPVLLDTIPAYLFGTDDHNTSSSGLLGPAWFRQEEQRLRPAEWPPCLWRSVLQPRPVPDPQPPQYDGTDDIPF